MTACDNIVLPTHPDSFPPTDSKRKVQEVGLRGMDPVRLLFLSLYFQGGRKGTEIMADGGRGRGPFHDKFVCGIKMACKELESGGI